MSAPAGAVRRRAALLACTLALALAAGAGAAPAGASPAGVSPAGVLPAGAGAPLLGNDVSWPQCPVAQGGFALPMPPTTAQLVVIGLTKGRPFTQNPCLATQLLWATRNKVPIQTYTMAGYPTSAQLARYGSQGPWQSTGTTGRLLNTGFSEALYAVQTLARSGTRVGTVWIDVETLNQQPWPTGSAAARQRNRLLLTGLMRGLDTAGISYGIYTNASAWTAITGRWWLPGIPAWVSAGESTQASAGAKCSAPSPSGGPARLAQWWDATRDYDVSCPSFVQTPPRPPVPLGDDLTGDWNDDLVARNATTGQLWDYPGTGTGALLPRKLIGNGWKGLDLLDRAGDLTGDGIGDLVARERATGSLWLYAGNGRGGWRPRVLLARGWQRMDALVGSGDVNGDRIPDLLARERSTGTLWLFPGNGTGGIGAGIKLGQGWSGLDVLVGTGDVTGDGIPDLLARSTGGAMWLYPGNGKGGFRSRTSVPGIWTGLDSFVVPGDLTGDGLPDLLARQTATGKLWLFAGTATGGWAPGVAIGSGWQVMNALA